MLEKTSKLDLPCLVNVASHDIKSCKFEKQVFSLIKNYINHRFVLATRCFLENMEYLSDQSCVNLSRFSLINHWGHVTYYVNSNIV